MSVSTGSRMRAPLQDLTCCLAGRLGALRGWWPVEENPRSHALTCGFRACGESRGRASIRGARDAYCQECAGCAGSTRDHLVSSGPRHSLLTHCITPLQCARLRAALFAFDLPIQLNYWHGELFSSVWGSRPGYRLPTHSRTNLARSCREGRLHREGEGFPAQMLGVQSGSGAVGAVTT